MGLQILLLNILRLQNDRHAAESPFRLTSLMQDGQPALLRKHPQSRGSLMMKALSGT